MHAKTINSEQIWQSSDGQRTIWDVTLQAQDGKEYKLKTYSAKIGKLGFEGDVRSYLNPRGERFVRQVPAAVPARSGFSRDDAAIRAQWAIGQAINLASVKMDKEAITLPVIERYAKELFATVSRVKGDDVTPELEAEADSQIKQFTKTAGSF
ncbi:MAG TPA: hypothetical protein VK983_05885 [Candidatus Limnocylindrales bacterium]|nr:hypothetical protein [Candidatus Limnocylindrales bacterium]